MTWIKTIKYQDTQHDLLKLYNQVKEPDNNVDNIMLAHSLRPHAMQGHMTLYKYTLHHPKNKIKKWFLECLGVNSHGDIIGLSPNNSSNVDDWSHT